MKTEKDKNDIQCKGKSKECMQWYPRHAIKTEKEKNMHWTQKAKNDHVCSTKQSSEPGKIAECWHAFQTKIDKNVIQ